MNQPPHRPQWDLPTEAGGGQVQTAAGPGADVATEAGQPDSSHQAQAAQLAPLRLAVGDVVGGCFRIERRLGAGGMGMVYLATHLQLERLVALKVHRSGSAEDQARLAREAKAMARLSHPGVIGVYDVRTHEGTLFIAMEFIDGCNGREWLAERRHGLTARLRLVLSVAEGLAAAHQAGLVHRDLKPENVLVGNNGRVVVADFGLARATRVVGAAAEASSQASLDVELTQAGAVMGTPAYMAPEQFSAGPVDARADQFALAIVAYEAAYGVRPFSAKSLPELVYQVTQHVVRPPPSETDVSPAIDEVLLRGLAPDPGQRFASVAAFALALRAAMRAPRRGALVIAVSSLVVLLALGAAGLAYFYDSWSDQRPRAVLSQTFDGTGLSAPLDSVSAELLAEASANVVEARRENRAARAVERLGKSGTMFDDPDAFSADIADAVDNDASVGSLLGAVLENQRKSAAAARDAPLQRVAWDGKTTLDCGLGNRLLVEGVDADVPSGPAIRVAAGCTIKIVDSTIRADTIVEGTMPDLVHLEGSGLQPRKQLLNIKLGRLVILQDVELEEPTSGAAVEFGMRTNAELRNCTLRGEPALRAAMHTKIDVTAGRLISEDVAIDAQMHAKVALTGTKLDGRTVLGAHARVDVIEK